MASTNHTAHLGLNQWIPSDPVIRTDFNSDNQKIDADLAAIPLRRLWGETLTETTQSIDLSRLITMDKTPYREVRIVIRAKTTAPSTTPMCLTVNNYYGPQTAYGGYARQQVGSAKTTASTESHEVTITIPFGYNKINAYHRNGAAADTTYDSLIDEAVVNWGNLTSLRLDIYNTSDARFPFAAGTRYTVYGVLW